MLSFIYMRILESRPRRYDRGVRWLSFGRIDRVRRQIAERLAAPGRRILDLGAGTGTLAFLCAERGAQVVGLDASAAMLAVAEQKRAASGHSDRVRFVRAGVAEIDTALAGQMFDAATATLVLSELSEDEQRYALAETHRLLAPGGRLAVADETTPRGRWRRILYHLLRLAWAAVVFVVTQTTTRPVRDLEDKVRAAGFVVDEVGRTNCDSLIVVHATKG